ncbi:HlyD family efflux transporter periplasmic adaptor subunit [Xanthobacteraceae bacterium Astr-EGSB]|uniref:efflux RND transporter periplasmic adaptor subunit n=1 Tax=Astrobacterium formosum TaxID=3069710 RepID=UPI0027ADBA46|nr:HlyD family efflux transporter periplasmic adaptor subunit [Xanthobacteraceae bacterium Astr-EGSB]
MKPLPSGMAPSSTAEAQLFGLSTLVQLVKRARHAQSMQELAFITVNETHSLVPYRQAVLWRRDRHGKGRVTALSGVPVVERNAPFVLWLERVFAGLDDKAPAAAARPVVAGDLAPALAQEWAEWLPANAVLVPLISPPQGALGALLFAREPPWNEAERYLLQETADGYAHAWVGLTRRRRTLFGGLPGRRRLLRLAIAAALIACLWLPITLTALAPAEVTPFEPTVVRAPLDGVVDRFVIQPNEVVKEGQLLLELDPRAIENKLEVAAKALAVAEAEYRQAAQQAVFDDKSRAQLAILKGRTDQRRADMVYAKSLLDRIHVTATRGGIALLDNPNDWIGRPVTIGERLLEIADPAQAELEIWLPVADAISLEPGARIDFFLNVAPDAPLSATVRQANYQATLSPGGVLAYRLKAELADKTRPPRIGLRGTAKVHGDPVTLFYYLIRRPLAAARQLVGY